MDTIRKIKELEKKAETEVKEKAAAFRLLLYVGTYFSTTSRTSMGQTLAQMPQLQVQTLLDGSFMKKFETVKHNVDFCVVGGGLSGICAAVAAARNGAKVAIMHDRPMFGGNCSSEIRMWVCGANGENNRETGIVEEIALENLWRNPEKKYPLWDVLLLDVARREKNLTLLLNCSCMDAESIVSDYLAAGYSGIVIADHYCSICLCKI